PISRFPRLGGASWVFSHWAHAFLSLGCVKGLLVFAAIFVSVIVVGIACRALDGIQDGAFYLYIIFSKAIYGLLHFFYSADTVAGNNQVSTHLLAYNGSIGNRQNRWRINQYNIVFFAGHFHHFL